VPNKIVILHPTGQKLPLIDDIVPFIKDYSSENGKAVAYVCLNYNCQLPTKDVGSVFRLLGSEEVLGSGANS
jgi:hypothetical protein